jgi:hypothetical protein
MAIRDGRQNLLVRLWLRQVCHEQLQLGSPCVGVLKRRSIHMLTDGLLHNTKGINGEVPIFA